MNTNISRVCEKEASSKFLSVEKAVSFSVWLHAAFHETSRKNKIQYQDDFTNNVSLNMCLSNFVKWSSVHHRSFSSFKCSSSFCFPLRLWRIWLSIMTLLACLFFLFFFSLHVDTKLFTGLVPAMVLGAESKYSIYFLELWPKISYCKHQKLYKCW